MRKSSKVRKRGNLKKGYYIHGDRWESKIVLNKYFKFISFTIFLNVGTVRRKSA